MLDPCMVIIVEPVPARLPRILALSQAASVDHADDTLPCPWPTVINTSRVPSVPCPIMHRTDVSDCHSVPSHPVCLWRMFAVYETSPMLDPCTVIDADPVPARLVRRIKRIALASFDQP
jgi:hypothetical protein